MFLSILPSEQSQASHGPTPSDANDAAVDAATNAPADGYAGAPADDLARRDALPSDVAQEDGGDGGAVGDTHFDATTSDTPTEGAPSGREGRSRRDERGVAGGAARGGDSAGTSRGGEARSAHATAGHAAQPTIASAARATGSTKTPQRPALRAYGANGSRAALGEVGGDGANTAARGVPARAQYPTRRRRTPPATHPDASTAASSEPPPPSSAAASAHQKASIGRTATGGGAGKVAARASAAGSSTAGASAAHVAAPSKAAEPSAGGGFAAKDDASPSHAAIAGAAGAATSSAAGSLHTAALAEPALSCHTTSAASVPRRGTATHLPPRTCRPGPSGPSGPRASAGSDAEASASYGDFARPSQAQMHPPTPPRRRSRPSTGVPASAVAAGTASAGERAEPPNAVPPSGASAEGASAPGLASPLGGSQRAAALAACESTPSVSRGSHEQPPLSPEATFVPTQPPSAPMRPRTAPPHSPLYPYDSALAHTLSLVGAPSDAAVEAGEGSLGGAELPGHSLSLTGMARSHEVAYLTRELGTCDAPRAMADSAAAATTTTTAVASTTCVAAATDVPAATAMAGVGDQATDALGTGGHIDETAVHVGLASPDVQRGAHRRTPPPEVSATPCTAALAVAPGGVGAAGAASFLPRDTLSDTIELQRGTPAPARRHALLSSSSMSRGSAASGVHLTPCCAAHARMPALSPDGPQAWQQSPALLSSSNARAPSSCPSGGGTGTHAGRRAALPRSQNAEMTPVSRLRLPEIAASEIAASEIAASEIAASEDDKDAVLAGQAPSAGRAPEQSATPSMAAVAEALPLIERARASGGTRAAEAVAPRVPQRSRLAAPEASPRPPEVSPPSVSQPMSSDSTRPTLAAHALDLINGDGIRVPPPSAGGTSGVEAHAPVRPASCDAPLQSGWMQLAAALDRWDPEEDGEEDGEEEGEEEGEDPLSTDSSVTRGMDADTRLGRDARSSAPSLNGGSLAPLLRRLSGCADTHTVLLWSDSRQRVDILHTVISALARRLPQLLRRDDTRLHTLRCARCLFLSAAHCATHVYAVGAGGEARSIEGISVSDGMVTRLDLARTMQASALLRPVCDALDAHPHEALRTLSALVHTPHMLAASGGGEGSAAVCPRGGDGAAALAPTGRNVASHGRSDARPLTAAGRDPTVAAAVSALCQAGHGLCSAVGQQVLALRSRALSWLRTASLPALHLLLHTCRAQPALGAALATDVQLQRSLWPLAIRAISGASEPAGGAAGEPAGGAAGEPAGGAAGEPAGGVACEPGAAEASSLVALQLLSLLLAHGAEQTTQQTRSEALQLALPYVSSLADGVGSLVRDAAEGATTAAASVAAGCLAELLRTDESAAPILATLQAEGGEGLVQRTLEWLEILCQPDHLRAADHALRVSEGECFGLPYTRAADGFASLLQRLLGRMGRKHPHLQPLAHGRCWRLIASALRSVSMAHAAAATPPGGGPLPMPPLLSHSGTLALVKAVHQALAKLPETSAPKLTQSGLLAALLGLLDAPERDGASSPLRALRAAPTARGGGGAAAASFLNAISLALYVPFGSRGERSAQALVQLQQAMYSGELLGALLRSLPLAEPHDAEVAVGLMSRLVLGSNHFAQQYVALGGLAPSVLQRMLQATRAPATLVDALLILCQIARLGERLGGRSTAAGTAGISSAGLGAALHASVLGERLPPLLSHADAGVRAKSCNLLGNLCKHSSDFYEGLLLQGGLLSLLAHRCADPDAQTRKFASFAVGNAGFHSARLYGHLTPTVAPLVECLIDPDPKTRANAAGALGNLARNGAQLCAELLAQGVPGALLRLAIRVTSPGCDDFAPTPQEAPMALEDAASEAGSLLRAARTALFSLGNLAAHAACRKDLTDLNVAASLRPLAEHVDPLLRQYAGRVLQKLGQTDR